MLEYLKEEANRTWTENGAAAYASAGSDCLDLFASIGALRQADGREVIARFVRAYAENPDTAMKLLFFARDIRGGLGERRVFRTIMHWLAFNYPGSVRKNIGFVAEYGRYDDLLCLMGTPCEGDMVSVLHSQFQRDLAALDEGGSISLLGKWLPSINASSRTASSRAKRLAKAFGLTDASYRKSLSALRKKIGIIENSLREKDYTFDYEKQPSRALLKYRKAFMRNDEGRYFRFLSAVKAGKAVLHADNVSPYELVEPWLTGGRNENGSFMRSMTPQEAEALNAAWASLPDFGNDENALAVIDTSGSMYSCRNPLPAAVALSLGLYFAEHNRGLFRNCFIEFSARPQLIELKGETFADRLRYAASFTEIANTNLEAVFDLVLSAAVKHHVPQEELPARLVLISDMEFDACVEDASAVIYENAEKNYAAHGYRLPEIVFWNAASRRRQQPVLQNTEGTVLVSGTTPRLFSMIAGSALSPLAFMEEVLSSGRYARIAA